MEGRKMARYRIHIPAGETLVGDLYVSNEGESNEQLIEVTEVIPAAEDSIDRGAVRLNFSTGGSMFPSSHSLIPVSREFQSLDELDDEQLQAELDRRQKERQMTDLMAFIEKVVELRDEAGDLESDHFELRDHDGIGLREALGKMADDARMALHRLGNEDDA